KSQFNGRGKKDRVFSSGYPRSKKHSLFNPPPRWRRLFSREEFIINLRFTSGWMKIVALQAKN
ncbi:MAG: hypothetical protein JXA21_14840, partial [Anaerolineae bacterium]|nr:hypothetical protein [Anaerolineae bacterium]